MRATFLINPEVLRLPTNPTSSAHAKQWTLTELILGLVIAKFLRFQDFRINSKRY